MKSTSLILYVFLMCGIAACSPKTDVPPQIKTASTMPASKQASDLKLMRLEFNESCQSRREYRSKRQNGTIEKYCACIFDKTMKGLSEEESLAAGFYLYGEKHEAFRKRFQEYYAESVPNFGVMAEASKAIAKAVKSCN